MRTAPYKANLNFRIRLLILAVAWIGNTTGCLKGPYDKSAVEAAFAEQQHATFSEIAVENHLIHYVTAGKHSAPLIFLIHGTPGSWHAYADLMTDELLLSRAYLIAVDRPGFGKSDKGGIVISLARQAALLQSLIEQESTNRKALLVGHSLGATIAARIAMDYPELVSGLVLVAPSLDPDLEKPRWYNKLAASAPVRWVVPRELALANREIMPLPAELTKMLSGWSRIQIPVIVVQGEQDKLVSPANANFAERILQHRVTVVRVTGQGHFIVWNCPGLIRDQIFALLPQQKK